MGDSNTPSSPIDGYIAAHAKMRMATVYRAKVDDARRHSGYNLTAETLDGILEASYRMMVSAVGSAANTSPSGISRVARMTFFAKSDEAAGGFVSSALIPSMRSTVARLANRLSSGLVRLPAVE
jgi:hypothetical protein